jgi:hypothetical protein
MIEANTMVTALAIITGILPLKRPNKNHSSVPRAKSEYINKEIPLVSFVRMVLTACGKNEPVVNIAAAKPMKVIMVMCFLVNDLLFLQAP